MRQFATCGWPTIFLILQGVPAASGTKTGRDNAPCRLSGPIPFEGVVLLRLSNLQVILILLLAGVVLIAAVLKYTSVAGRIPAAMWDICTSVIAPANNATSGRTEPGAGVTASAAARER